MTLTIRPPSRTRFMNSSLPRSKLTDKISGWRGGDGPALVLIHGVGLNADAWNAMLPALLDTHTVTLVDMPGHGDSKPLAKGAALSDYTCAIAEAIDAPSVIVGHSMGALIAMDLAIHHQHLVKAAVPLNAIFRRTLAASAAVKARVEKLQHDNVPDPSATLARWFGETPTGDLALAAENCRHWLTHVDPRGYETAYRAFAHADGPSDQDLESIRAPMFFMTGSDEPNSTPAMSEALANRVPHGRCAIIQAARHMMTLTHADEINTRLLQFINHEVASNGQS